VAKNTQSTGSMVQEEKKGREEVSKVVLVIAKSITGETESGIPSSMASGYG